MKKVYKILIGLILVIGGLSLAWVVTHKSSQSAPATEKVRRRNIVSSIDFTGHVASKHSAKLGFESSGIAQRVSVEIGDSVKAGQVLATIDTDIGQLEVAQAKASQSSAAATAASALAEAQTSLNSTRTANAQTVAQAQQTVRDAKAELDQVKVAYQQTAIESGDQSSITQTKHSAVLSAESTYKTAQAALKTAQAAADKSNQSAQSTVNTAQTAYTNTQQASSTESGLSSLQAAEQIARVRLAKQSLRAPFDGVVTAKSIDSGELAIAGQPLMTIENINDVEIQADVPETQVAKLVLNQTGTTTLDAYDSTEIWPVKVAKIDPTATTIEGVPTYRVTIDFTQWNNQLKPGLTTTVTIDTQIKYNILSLPRKAITREQNKSYVQLVTSPGKNEKREVSTGITDVNGTVEIISGVAEGDTVLLPQSKP